MHDRDGARGLAHLLDHVAVQPARPLGRVGREDDLVDRRLELRERIARRVDRAVVDDEPVRRDRSGTQRLQRLLEPSAGRGATRVLVDDVALARLVHRADDRDQVVGAGLLLQRVEQRPARHRLVRDHEEVPHVPGPSNVSKFI